MNARSSSRYREKVNEIMATSSPLPPTPGTTRTPRAGSDRKLLFASAAAVGAVAMWANIKGREYARTGETPSLINWKRARSIAFAMNRDEGVAVASESALAEYREMVAQCEPLIAGYMGAELPQAMEQIYVFNRVDWIEANVRAFADLFAPLEGLNTARTMTSPTAIALVSGFNQTVLSAEIGVLLGYLARRVLGQYDLALLGKEPVSFVQSTAHLLGALDALVLGFVGEEPSPAVQSGHA